MSRGTATVARATGFLALWLVLAGADTADLPAAAVAVAAATWASLRLLPPGEWHPSPVALLRLLLRLPPQAVVAGIDLAWRALDSDMELRPGVMRFRPTLPPGTARDAFCTHTGLLPGTLPAGTDKSGALLIHCVDVGLPVAAQLAAEEALFVRALVGNRGDG